PAGPRLASGGFDGTVRVWEARSGKKVLTFSEHAGPVFSVSFSPDGGRLASAGLDTVRVWDARSGKQALPLEKQPEAVAAVSFSPDGKRLAGAGLDEAVKVWGADGGRAVRT